jgi:uncharacterized protein YjbI with pentapeptide repeats
MPLRSLIYRLFRAFMRRDFNRDARRDRPSPDRIPRQPWRPRPIRSWVLLVVFSLILIGGWCYYELQMAEIESLRATGDAQVDLEIAKMRLDTVRATLTVAAGIGAASALVLSFRRQQHDEFHNTQQRITELRMQAVEQLSSTDHTIRRSGLYNLERLGEQHEELRQLVLDEICSYLRRPFDQDATSASHLEREVRAFATEILERRLKRQLGPRNYWNHTRLNLKNAELPSVDFSDCHFRNANFTGVRFRGVANFERASFVGTTWFSWAVFEGKAKFFRAKFRELVSFDLAVFRADVDFARAKCFIASFGGVRFTKGFVGTLASFYLVQFRESFFEGSALFDGVVFRGPTSFERSVFASRVNFDLARFASAAVFKEADFGGNVKFTGVGFDRVDFERATFQTDVDFDQSIFKGHSVFREAVCKEGASFRDAHFHQVVDFGRSAFLGDVLLSGALFRRLLCDQALPGNYRLVEPRSGRMLLYWTVREPDGSEPSAPHLAFGELGL